MMGLMRNNSDPIVEEYRKTACFMQEEDQISICDERQAITDSLDTDTTSIRPSMNKHNTAESYENLTTSIGDHLTLSTSLPQSAIDAFFDASQN